MVALRFFLVGRVEFVKLRLIFFTIAMRDVVFDTSLDAFSSIFNVHGLVGSHGNHGLATLIELVERGLKKSWRARRHPPVERLLEQARICRVERVMRPYLEATA